MKKCSCYGSLSLTRTCQKSITDIPIFPMAFQNHRQQTSAFLPADLVLFYLHGYQFLRGLGAIRMYFHRTDRYFPFFDRNFNIKIRKCYFRNGNTVIKIFRECIWFYGECLSVLFFIDGNSIFKHRFRLQ